MYIEGQLKIAIYHKSFQIGHEAKSQHTPGKIINLINNDTELIGLSPSIMVNIWAIPLSLTLAIYSLVKMLGVLVVPSMAIPILALLTTVLSGPLLGKHFSTLMKAGDDRMTKARELFQNIEIVKYFAMESRFSEGIMGARNQELNSFKQVMRILLSTQSLSTSAVSYIHLVNFDGSCYLFMFCSFWTNLESTNCFPSDFVV